MKLELVYLSKGKYCVYPLMVYRLAIVMTPPPPHFGWLNITFDLISHHFRSIRNFFFFLNFFHKMAAGGHFGWPKIIFDHISRHFRSIHNFCFFTKAAGGHFGWPKITFNHISRHFRSIRNFDFFHILEVRFAPKTIGFFHYVLSMSMPNMKLIGEFLTQLEMPQAFGAFLYAISDQYTTFVISQNGCRGHFGWPKITFNHISRHFRSIRNFDFF